MPVINHTFVNIGKYNVTLTVIDDKGLNASVWELVIVEREPIAHFTISKKHDYGEELPPDSYYVNDTLTFDASSSRPDGGEIVWYLWNFGDGTPVENTTASSTTHIYTSPGTYTVNLTIADNNTLTHSYQKTINIEIGFPIASFKIYESPPYYVNDTLTFDASASHDSDWGHIVKYNWDFGDDTPVYNATTPITSHKYIAKGDYVVALTVIDNSTLPGVPFNMTLSVRLRVYLRVEPQNATANPGEKTLNINVTTANVEDLKSFKFKITWTPVWLPPTWPTLLGTPLEVNEGDFLGDQFDFEGRRRWIFRYTPSIGEGYILVNCTFTDIVPLEERTGSGTLVNIILSVRTTGNSTLNLTDILLLNSNGNITLEVENGYFYTTRPVANFDYSPRTVTPNQPVIFNASLSFDPDNLYDPTPGVIANYTWDFDDGTNATGMIVDHTFASGVFSVNLTVTDDDGETWYITYYVSTANVTLYIEPSPLAFNETAGLYETAGVLPLTVIVTNNGVLTQNFTVTVYANDTSFENQTVTILAGASENLTFRIYAFQQNDTHSLPKGNYNISAHVLDNVKYADHLVRIWLKGDVDRNNEVNIFDIVRMAGSYSSQKGDLRYNPNSDLDCDRDVDIFDIVIAAGNYGAKDP